VRGPGRSEQRGPSRGRTVRPLHPLDLERRPLARLGTKVFPPPLDTSNRCSVEWVKRSGPALTVSS
jgi:hypothetical protein